MVRLKRKKPGTAPGTLEYTGDKTNLPISISVYEYDSLDCKIKTLQDLQNYQAEANKINWLDIDGLHDTKLIGKLEELFKIHPLVLEDCVNTHQYPKVDEYDDYIFLVLKMISLNGKILASEQVSLILGPNFVITLQDGNKDVFDPIRERLSTGKGKVRKASPDYLFYLLVDSIIDHYFIAIDHFDERVEFLDKKIINDLSRVEFAELQHMKRKLLGLRRSIAPVKDLISTLIKFECEHIQEQNIPYFRDLYDHAVQALDLIDLQRDILMDISNVHISLEAHKTNDVMRTLTVISTIFMPLTFIVGVYGMNFKVMPELEWQYGYLMTWLIIIIIVAGMLKFFRNKKWL
jgi:magnesium transporter